MLVLSRKLGEQILIDGDIVITVLRVQGNRVRLGIDAPDSVAVKRGEIEIELPDEEDRDEARAAIEATEKPHGCLANRTEC